MVVIVQIFFLTIRIQLTNSTERSPSSEANTFLTSREIPSGLWFSKVHYPSHNSLPLVPILKQINPVQASPSQRIENPFQYYPPIYIWVFQVVFFNQVSPPNSCTHLSFFSYVLHAPRISFS